MVVLTTDTTYSRSYSNYLCEELGEGACGNCGDEMCSGQDFVTYDDHGDRGVRLERPVTLLLELGNLHSGQASWVLIQNNKPALAHWPARQLVSC